MKSIQSTVAALMLLALPAACTARGDDPAPPAKPPAAAKPAASPLEPVAFLVGEWEAKLPPNADGSRAAIIARFSWAENHQAIRLSNSFVMGGKPLPYLDGMYAWHPGRRVISFWYVDARGGLSEGTVKPEGGVAVHEFTETSAAGEVGHYTARVTLEGADAWTNEILALKEGKLEPVIKVRYERIKAEKPR